MEKDLINQAKRHLDILCNQIDNRCVGRPGNRQATDYFKEQLHCMGHAFTVQPFNCIEWYPTPVRLKAGRCSVEAHVSPYSSACQLKAGLVHARTLDELEQITCGHQILLISGQLAKEQLMPKHFVFFNPEEHQNIYRLLEEKAPSAIITATGKNPDVAGSLYPFPMIEDGDFDIPSVYIKDADGLKLEKFAGQDIQLAFESDRIPSQGCNVIGRLGREVTDRIVISAHIDSKPDTPGALDNGSGIVVLLLLAELLKDYRGRCGIELLALNGEDYYAVPGQMTYIKAMNNRFDDIRLNINIDGAGYYQEKTAVSFYNLDDKQQSIMHLIGNEEIKEGTPWYQSDHSIFAMNGRPAIAVTSGRFMEKLSVHVTHTPEDRTTLVDIDKLIKIARAVKKIIEQQAMIFH